jgi:hypothetical protein
MQDHLFIARIPPEISSEQVMALLASIGEVKNFHRPTKRETGQPETYAFATLASEELAQLAIERLNNHLFDENLPPLVVKFADNRNAPTNLFLAKVPITFSDEQITALFAEIGAVKQFHRPKRKNGEPQKYAFLTMASAEAAQQAVEKLDGYPLGDDLPPLIVKYSNERADADKDDSAGKPRKENFKKYDELAAQIAQQLGETEAKPTNLIKRIIQKCGVEQTQAWVTETMQIEAQGGLIIERLDRRRTTGGVFFYISKLAMPPDVMNEIFPRDMWGKKKKAAKEGGQTPVRQPVEDYKPFDWEHRMEEIQEMLHEEGGKVSSVKVVVVGRPDSVKININEVTLTIKRNFQLTHVPKGIPHPTPFTTITTIYVPLKMWNKVQEALKDPEDRLVVEGFVSIESNKPGYSVYGTLVTTANLQRARFAKSDSPEQG